VRFTNHLKALGIHRERVGFYSLRHAFETIAGGSKDPVAVDLIVGHTDGSMAAHYRERIDDARLRAVVDHVRAWLWPVGK
jgi:integrase